MGQLIIVIVLIGLGYVIGSIAEKKHYRSIISRETQLLHIPTVSVKNTIEVDVDIIDARMVQGSVVISIDHFKRILASLRNIFGGRVAAYESLIDRARREAILRMKEKSPNADIVLNTRIETSTIGRSANSRKSIGSIEAMAYGTAVSYRKRLEIFAQRT